MKYHEISFKASHNSYERDEPIQEQLEFFAGDPARCGCRGLELDIWRNTKQTERFFTVDHSTSNKGYPLAYYFGLLLSYHFNYPQHDVILVDIDIKSDDNPQTFPQELDAYIARYFNKDLVFTPRMLMSDPGVSLCENVIRFGWPETAAMAGKFVFCLTGNTAWKEFYAGSSLATRLCFSDQEVSDNNGHVAPPSRGNFVFFNMNVFTDHYSTWKNTLPQFLHCNLITRVYELGSEFLWTRSLAAAASVLTTDQVSGRTWAKVGPAAFVKRKTG